MVILLTFLGLFLLFFRCLPRGKLSLFARKTLNGKSTRWGEQGSVQLTVFNYKSRRHLTGLVCVNFHLILMRNHWCHKNNIICRTESISTNELNQKLTVIGQNPKIIKNMNWIQNQKSHMTKWFQIICFQILPTTGNWQYFVSIRMVAEICAIKWPCCLQILNFVRCERLFFLQGHVVNSKRASLSQNSINRLVCLSNWLNVNYWTTKNCFHIAVVRVGRMGYVPAYGGNGNM